MKISWLSTSTETALSSIFSFTFRNVNPSKSDLEQRIQQTKMDGSDVIVVNSTIAKEVYEGLKEFCNIFIIFCGWFGKNDVQGWVDEVNAQNDGHKIVIEINSLDGCLSRFDGQILGADAASTVE